MYPPLHVRHWSESYGDMMALSDVMATVVEERKTPKGDKKHYIPFTTEEFEKVREAFKRPAMMPNDIKLVILAICDGTLDLVRAEK